jgi:hypothetical protein
VVKILIVGFVLFCCGGVIFVSMQLGQNLPSHRFRQNGIGMFGAKFIVHYLSKIVKKSVSKKRREILPLSKTYSMSRRTTTAQSNNTTQSCAQRHEGHKGKNFIFSYSLRSLRLCAKQKNLFRAETRRTQRKRILFVCIFFMSSVSPREINYFASIAKK